MVRGDSREASGRLAGWSGCENVKVLRGSGGATGVTGELPEEKVGVTSGIVTRTPDEGKSHSGSRSTRPPSNSY